MLRQHDRLRPAKGVEVVQLVMMTVDKHGRLLMVAGHVLGDLGLVCRLRGLNILVEHRLSLWRLVSTHQKVFRLHIHGCLIHQRIPSEECRLHQLHLAQGRHRVRVHEC